jgi:sigma-B regulation protein RsbU (phosphoserine phosphatase)
MNHFLEAIYLTDGVIFLFLGLIILKENPHLRINRVTGILLFFAALGSILGACEVSVTGNEFAQHLVVRTSAFWQFFFPQLLIFAIYYPSKIVSAEQRRIPYLLFIPQTFQLLLVVIFESPEQILALNTFFETHVLNGFLQPLTLICQIILGLLAYFFEIHRNLFALVNLTFTILALTIIYRGYRQLSELRIKNQVRVICTGVWLSLGMLALAGLLPNIFALKMNGWISHGLTATGATLGAATIAWAIIKHQFLDIRFFIRKSIIFSMVSSVLIGCYLFVYLYLKQFFSQLVGLDLPILEILFLIFAAVFFQPLLSSIEKMVTKHFFRQTPDYQKILQDLSHEILHILDLEELRQKLTAGLTETMALESFYLLLNDGTGNFSTRNPAGQTTDFVFENGTDFIRLINQFEQPVLMEKIETRLNSPAERQQLQKMKVQLFVPLTHRGELEGILFLGQKLNEINFSSEDLTLLNILSTQIAIALENARLYQEMVEKHRIDEEIGLAREIQRMLLPQQFPANQRYEISAINIPSKEVGGDYYDFIEISENQIGIAIGDISGKGIPGSLLMSNLQATFRAVAHLSTDPSRVMNLVNVQIARSTTPEKYATFFYGIFDAATNMLKYTNAGHNFPIIVPENGAPFMLKESDLIIGIDENAGYRQHQVKLSPGDLLICYTDGITEALNAENVEFGEERFLTTIMSQNWNSTRELRNQIYETVKEFAAGTNQYDDMTLVILQIK